MNRSEKAAIIEKIKEVSSSASFVAVADFKGMTVEELTDLRNKIRAVGGTLYVVKNTLARIALEGSTHDAIAQSFKENCAIALGIEEPVAVAKALSEFAKTSKKFNLRHGSLDGKFVTVEQIEALASLPSREQLLGQVLGTMNAVPTNLVSLMANMIRPLLYVLKDIESKKAA